MGEQMYIPESRISKYTFTYTKMYLFLHQIRMYYNKVNSEVGLNNDLIHSPPLPHPLYS